jgi:hypothetical protein
MQIKVRLDSRLTQRWVQHFSKQKLLRAARMMVPTLVALTFAGVAHAQGTMDFSGAQTLMGTFKTFAIYAGAIICFGGLIFAGIRMMSGRFQDAIPGLFGALFGAGVLGWGAGWIGFDHGYAVTSHRSQGLTADRVLVNIDTNTHPDLITSRFAYVSVSRAAQDAQIYTDSATSLAANLSHDVSKSSAISIGDLGAKSSPVEIGL